MGVCSWHLMAGRGGSNLCPGLAMPQWAASDLCTECSQHGGCNLSGSHLLTVGWGSGPMGRGRLISSPLARALYFHFSMDLAGKWSTSKTVEMGRSQLLFFRKVEKVLRAVIFKPDFLKINLFIYIYFWLCWVFISVRGLSPVVASGGHSSSRCAGLLPSRPLPLRSTGSRHAGSVVVAHGPSCSAACGIFPDQGSNPCPLH